MMQSRSLARRIIAVPLTLLAMLIVLFEATFWRWMTALGHYLADRIPFFSSVERIIDRMSPRWVGTIFIIPLLVLIPVHLAATWLLFHRHFATAIAMLVSLKIIGTAISARLFALAKPKLLLLPSFAFAYRHVTGWIRFAHEYVENLPAWRATRRIIAGIRQFIHTHQRGRFARRVAAVKRWAARAG